jgi:hypothetical protein
MQKIYNSIIQVAKVPSLKPAISQLTEENCLPAFNPRFIGKMIKNFIQDKDERKLLVQLNNRLAGKTFLKEVFEMNDDKLFELVKLAIKPDSPQSRSLIETQLNLSEPVQLKSLFKFADLLDQKILKDSSVRDLFISKLERLDFHDFAQEALKTQADIPKPLFEKILKTKVENIPDSATALLKLLKDNPIFNRNNLKLFDVLQWSKSKFNDLDSELFSRKPDGTRVFSGEFGPLVLRNMLPFISEIPVNAFLEIIEQAKNGQEFSAKPFRIALHRVMLGFKRIDYSDPEVHDYLVQFIPENQPPMPILASTRDQASLEEEMLLEGIYKTKLKSFSLPINNESRKLLLERIRDLDPVTKEKVFSAMKIPNKQILTELIQSKIFPVNLHDRLLEGFSTKPESCLILANQAFSKNAREDLLFRIIGANKANLGPVVNNLNKVSNSLNEEGGFLKDFIVKVGESKDHMFLAGKILEHLPDLGLAHKDILDIFPDLKYVGSKTLNTMLANPKFPIASKLHLLKKVVSSSLSADGDLQLIPETKKYTRPVGSALIPENQDLSLIFDSITKMPSEIQGKMFDHLKLNSGAQLQKICEIDTLSSENLTKLVKSIGSFDKDLLPCLLHEKLIDDSKEHILKLAYFHNKQGLVNFLSSNKHNPDIKKPLISFVKRNASLIEYLPSFDFSSDEMKKIVEGLTHIDPRNYKNIFFPNGDGGILKSNPLSDEMLGLLAQRAFQDAKNVHEFTKFVIKNEDKLTRAVSLSEEDRARLVKSISSFDKDLLPCLFSRKLTDESKEHILDLAYLQDKQGLVDFLSSNKNNADIKKLLSSFVKPSGNLLEYLPSLGFSPDEMKQAVQGLTQIDPRNYKNIFLRKGNNVTSKVTSLTVDILKLLTRRALADTKNGEEFIKFVISNEAKLYNAVKEAF